MRKKDKELLEKHEEIIEYLIVQIEDLKNKYKLLYDEAHPRVMGGK